jgi:DNA helicase-2/ATP-dependent DNA helicase PcrA
MTTTPLIDRVLTLLPDARLSKVAAGQDKEILIFGPPGTGKTRSLGVLLDAHIQAGLPASEMLVNAFTRNATAELRRRLSTQYGLTDNEMTWVRTIHSSCFQLLQLRSEQVMSSFNLRQFGNDTGYKLQGVLNQRSFDDPYAVGSIVTMGDWCYIAEELRRVTLRDYQQNWVMLNTKNPTSENWTVKDARHFSDTYAQWKKESGLVDFTDMLELVIKYELRPTVNWIFLDEAQDMTPLQWKVADLWAQEAVRLMSFSDDDQAIFSWAGADPAELLKRNAHRIVLSHSYRLPSAVHQAANKIIKRVTERVEKDFEPHSIGGKVSTVHDWMEVAAKIDPHKDESWLLLVRNRAYAVNIRGALVEAAVPFRDRTSPAGIPALDSARGRALAVLMELHAGEMVRGSRLRLLQRQVYPDMWPSDKTTWGQSYSVVDLIAAGAKPELATQIAQMPLAALRLDPGERNYLELIWRRHGADRLLAVPPVEISTIHGAKGEEARHVAVSVSMTRRTRQDYEDDPDSERRCFYVAATRALEEVIWVLDGPGWIG